MWQQYKKTFVGMQSVIALVTVAAYFFLYRGNLRPTALFFVTLQICAVYGASWGFRLKNRKQWRA